MTDGQTEANEANRNQSAMEAMMRRLVQRMRERIERGERPQRVANFPVQFAINDGDIEEAMKLSKKLDDWLIEVANTKQKMLKLIIDAYRLTDVYLFVPPTSIGEAMEKGTKELIINGDELIGILHTTMGPEVSFTFEPKVAWELQPGDGKKVMDAAAELERMNGSTRAFFKHGPPPTRPPEVPTVAWQVQTITKRVIGCGECGYIIEDQQGVAFNCPKCGMLNVAPETPKERSYDEAKDGLRPVPGRRDDRDGRRPTSTERK